MNVQVAAEPPSLSVTGLEEAYPPAIILYKAGVRTLRRNDLARLIKVSLVIRLVAIILLTGLAIAILIFLPVRNLLYEFLEWIRAIGPWGPLLLGMVYIVATVLFVPGFILTLGAGLLFGVVVGTMTVSLASTLGASAAFLLGRTIARPWIQRKIAYRPKFQALDEAVKRQGFKIVLFVRLSPAFPFNLVNYAFGLTQVSLHDYVLASWIGMFPATVMYNYVGSTLKSLADLAAGKIESGPGQKILFGIGLAATIVVTLFVTRLSRKALEQAVPIQQEAVHRQP
jgi:uncharacterized membrane protein YdjX (TVP38/TMEM64 family)